ncbi:aldo/keto reductase [Tunicatimonas pelagia]|uniref:aldo/keto reductase n=1 Tax=Tunicatimonas pelagia TaxID=931531 RepID=UPI002666D91F|nr:aldo/keto reductase [Tunicatimonas pelagia]WKN44866.1 aldo/keto reductase [Tunicatimonas pelagia]
MNTTKITATIRPAYRSDGPLPGLVLGTAGLGGVWGTVNRHESVKTILYALENGIEQLDTAPAYGQAEIIVGEALRQWRGQRPFVSTKVGKLRADAADQETNDYTLASMQRSVEESRKVLGTDCLDLLFLHEPNKVPADRTSEVVNFMQQVKQAGHAKALGLGGIVPSAFHEFIRRGVFDVVMSYNNLNAACLDGLQFDIPFFRAHGLTTYQGSALLMGLLGNRFERYQQHPPSWISSADLVRAKQAEQLARRLGIKLSALAHRYLLSMQEVDYLVLGAKNMTQLTDTLADCEAGMLEETLFEELTNLIQ